MDSKPAPDWWARNWTWLVPAGCPTALNGVAGFLVTGSVRLSGGSGQARLAIPLEGPKGSGTWTTSTFRFQPNGGGSPINLLRSAI